MLALVELDIQSGGILNILAVGYTSGECFDFAVGRVQEAGIEADLVVRVIPGDPTLDIDIQRRDGSLASRLQIRPVTQAETGFSNSL